MTNKEKEKMLKLLFPTEEIRKFMCNDFYQELLGIIPISLCISETNRNANVRDENYIKVRETIKKFVLTEKNNSEMIFQLYHFAGFNYFIELLLEGYVFYITSVSARHKKIDMYKDGRSIFYKKICTASLM